MAQSIIDLKSLLNGETQKVKVRALLKGRVVAGWRNVTLRISEVKEGACRASVTVKVKKAMTFDAVEIEHSGGKIRTQAPGGRTPVSRNETMTIEQLVIIETIKEDDKGVVIG